MGNEMTGFQTLEVAPIAGALGAEIKGVDLRHPLDALQRSEIHEALMRHLVVFFRDQPLSEDEQLQFASVFGSPYRSSTDPDAPGALFTTPVASVLPEVTIGRPEHPVPLALAPARRRRVGRAVHQPPRPFRPLPELPDGAALPCRRGRSRGSRGSAASCRRKDQLSLD